VCALPDFELAGWCSLSLGGAAPSTAPDHARAGGHGAADSFLVLSGGGRRGRAMGSASPTAALQQHGEGVSGVCALWHFRLSGSCSLSVGGWAPSGAANPGRPVLADGWADIFLVFDVGAGSELWGRLGHDRIETAWLRGLAR
jgi:hypothetical protein